MNSITKEISEIITVFQQINEEMLRTYTPKVKDMCDRKNVTQSELEHFLDYLVSACISNDMLLLFKKVCRRFYKEYPETITAYNIRNNWCVCLRLVLHYSLVCPKNIPHLPYY